ncbi:DUF4194 domain-containing protein [Hymenobacter sp. BRD128]|uniref:DUF4194 domain-containing protein n=1 Tax=Hymenobacter sp. BRD128 TaxID=2675878 RepID=UPI001567741B|nr:DUF4194 domain-containing protein [Hymenobacter sp. BRD128]QKG58767.1 DUF4194 domain-containing protein [Hymenobacter sp. BRD128]
MPAGLSFAHIARRLLRGPIYSDQDRDWQALAEHLPALQSYFGKLELRVRLQNTDGYALLEDAVLLTDEDDADPVGPTEQLPPLLRRDKLSYDVTLLCVLLRQRLDDHDAAGTASSGGRLYLTQQDLFDLLNPFFKEDTNQVRRTARLKKSVDGTVAQGFLVQTQTYAGEEGRIKYEVKRILKARIDNDALERFQQQLSDYLGADTTA